MKTRNWTPARVLAALAFSTSTVLSAGALAQTVKIGVVLPYTGVGAEFGQQVDRGMQMFMKLNPKAFEPYKIEIVKRDSKNPSGAEAKVAVQELIAQEKVDLLTGFINSPDAIASRHVLSVVLNAMGRHDEALAEAIRERAEWARLTSICAVRWEMGTPADRAQSDQALATMIEKHAGHSAIQIAHLFTIRHDVDAAFEWLSRAIQQRDPGATYCNTLPFFDPLKHDPRWKPMLEKLGFKD